MFHRHHWREKERFYAPPIVGNHSLSVTERTIKQMMLGVTTITQECFHCGKLKTVEVLGDARRPGQ